MASGPAGGQRAFTECFPLDGRSQARNIALYVLSNWLLYLAAPVVYVGITQASLCNRLGASGALANLPSSAFFWMAAVPIVFTWRFPNSRAVKPIVAACYGTCAVAGLLVAASLALPLSNGLRIGAVVLYACLIGGSLATLAVFLWDILNRGVDRSRRGIAFCLAFGFGPAFAVIGSFLAQLALAGEIDFPYPSRWTLIEMHTIKVPTFEFPFNFVMLFGATIPIMLANASLAGFYILPAASWETPRQAFFPSLRREFREIIGDRVVFTAMIAFLVIAGGATILNNISLFTTEAIGRSPEALAGSQNALRFTFKSLMGLLLGWLLVRTHAKLGMLATSACSFLGVAWVLCMPRQWFLVSFGLMGAGELYEIYFQNYLVNCSRQEKVRITMALLSLLGILSSFAPTLFGAVSDQFGFHASFAVAACAIGGSFALVLLGLPARATPMPRLAEQNNDCPLAPAAITVSRLDAEPVPSLVASTESRFRCNQKQ